ncbi:MAG: hypothetical protein Q7V10_06270 [Methanobacteriaceae archaeon]|jgi:hypothetical protein|nr:hypothetical protein [Methanobacteriaceae archaeon]MDO9626655.1 hypothetical protein [Methanobacteriaceae archaeon]
MNKNILFIALIVILVAIIGVAAYMMLTPSAEPSQVGEKGTKFAIHNNGTTWAHVDMIIENATLKNGTVQNFYIETWMKPTNGSVVIDLSKLLGYGNEKLPAGTTIRIVGWKGLYDSASTTNQDLNLKMEGWSNTINPLTNNNLSDVLLNNLTVAKLPNNLTDNTVIIGNSISEVEQNDNLDGISLFNELVYEEELLTVNADGSVSIVFTQIPALCSLPARIV